MMEKDKSSVILVKRDNRYIMGHNPYILVCDDEELGNVWKGETRYFNVRPGRHIIRIIGAGLGRDSISNTVEVDLLPGQMVVLRSITHRKGTFFQFREAHQTLKKVLFQLELVKIVDDVSCFPDHETTENCIHDPDIIDSWYD